MGGAVGSRGHSLSEDSVDVESCLQDANFPWFQLIQWCAEDAKANSVFQWDLAEIQRDANALTLDVETFVRRCPDELPSECCFSMEEDKVFAEWAESLLDWSASLQQVRFRLVP